VHLPEPNGGNAGKRCREPDGIGEPVDTSRACLQIRTPDRVSDNLGRDAAQPGERTGRGVGCEKVHAVVEHRGGIVRRVEVPHGGGLA